MLGKGMIGDCIGYRNEASKLVFVRQMFQGKTAADVTFAGAAPGSPPFNPERSAPICSPRILQAKPPSAQLPCL